VVGGVTRSPSLLARGSTELGVCLLVALELEQPRLLGLDLLLLHRGVRLDAHVAWLVDELADLDRPAI
jgi:hypothetical protein